MIADSSKIRVLYSFPHKLGAGRICTTAWHQVEGIAAAGADVTVFAGCISRPLPSQVKVHTTLAWKSLRLPYRLLGTLRACALHDWIVARKLEALAGRIDVVHVWPLAAWRTIGIAKKLGIPTVLERPNAHTRFAYSIVREECERLGIKMPPGHEHDHNQAVLDIELDEYDRADKLLCPSDFVARTFLDQGFPAEKLLRHQYGFDEKTYYPDQTLHCPNQGLTFIFAGGCAPRKGLHYALDAWLQSSASSDGEFQIVGGFIPGYAEVLSKQLAHPRVKVLGHRNDMADLMRISDVLVLPSIEEGSALVTYEARGSGCVLLVSDAAGAICNSGKDGLIHKARDVKTLAAQMSLLHENRPLLEELRSNSLRGISALTWKAAGVRLLNAYGRAISEIGAK